MTINRFLFLLFAFLALWLPPAGAQSLAKTFTLNAANQSACVGTGGLPTVGIVVSGTWSATLQPQVSVNGSPPQSSSATSTVAGSQPAATITANGSYVAPVGGFDTFCLQVTAFTSGPATVILNPSPAISARLGAGSTPGGSVTSVTIAGTASQIDAAGTCAITTTGICTLSLDPAILLPGTIEGAGGIPVPGPAGFDVQTAGGFDFEIANNASTGTVNQELVCDDGTIHGLVCPAASSTTNKPIGFAITGAGTTGNVTGCMLGWCTLIFDGQTVANDYAIESSTMDGQGHDVGASAPTNGQPFWLIVGANAGAGTAAQVRLLTTDLEAAFTGFINPMTTLGDLIYENSTPAAARLAGPTSPAGIPQNFCSTPSGGLATAPGWCIPGVAIDAQTGTTFSVPITDTLKFITASNSGATAWTGFTLANNYAFSFENINTGLITFTPASGTVNGNSTQIIPHNYFGFHYTDNTNTFMPVMPTLAAFPSCADTGGNHLNINTSTGAITCGTSSSGGSGTVTSIATNSPITGGTITTTGTIACATCVTSASSLTSTQIMTGAGSQASQTPSSAATVDSSGNLNAATLIASGIIDGKAPVTITTGASCTLGTASGCNSTKYLSGYTYNQEATAATAITYTLPTAAVGLQYCVKNSNNAGTADTGTITIQTSGAGQTIDFNGTVGASDGYVISGGAAGDAGCVVGISTTQWEFYAQVGAWAVH